MAGRVAATLVLTTWHLYTKSSPYKYQSECQWTRIWKGATMTRCGAVTWTRAQQTTIRGSKQMTPRFTCKSRAVQKWSIGHGKMTWAHLQQACPSSWDSTRRKKGIEKDTPWHKNGRCLETRWHHIKTWERCWGIAHTCSTACNASSVWCLQQWLTLNWTK